MTRWLGHFPLAAGRVALSIPLSSRPQCLVPSLSRWHPRRETEDCARIEKSIQSHRMFGACRHRTRSITVLVPSHLIRSRQFFFLIILSLILLLLLNLEFQARKGGSASRSRCCCAKDFRSSRFALHPSLKSS
ncbi:hypothetical protein N656DRAFT_427385 [Canariomyces notabilis]|uniref:Transmembrane protein n=1 Tax=Canariomyces notabilis TaxID=2074819 RepID=A0AAN6QGL0_9PEZI|nr:hypothetical protein N656DRAFT_427385 [Canariomyces arenarius]